MHVSISSDSGVASANHGRPPINSFGQACGECRIVEEADHRIANHLSLIAGFVRLKAADLAQQRISLKQESVQLLLENVRSQIDAVARLHRALALGGRHASTNLAEHLHEVCAPLAAILPARINLLEEFSTDRHVQPGQIIPISQIVVEAVTNAAKHAYPLDEVGEILVRILDNEGRTVVEVADNGSGLPPTFDPTTSGGLGFRLIRSLGKQLAATIEYQSGPTGLHFRLILPAAASSSAL
jgi:two-component sensor histidine kinase